MSIYSDSTRLAILAIQDANMIAAEGIGLAFTESAIQLAYATMAGGVGAGGIPGTPTVTYVVIAPRPVVDLRDQYRTRGDQTVHVGDGRMSVTRTITRTQLLTASWVEIDGEKYTLVAGELRKMDLCWDVTLKRMQA